MSILSAEKNRTQVRERAQRRRSEFFTGKLCIDCGSGEKLELDHLDQTAKESHRIWTWSEPRLQSEAAKCEVRCRPCHLKRHFASEIKHSVTRYRKGCRCEVCIEAMRANKRRQHKAQRETFLKAIAPVPSNFPWRKAVEDIPASTLISSSKDRVRPGKVETPGSSATLQTRPMARSLRVIDSHGFVNAPCLAGGALC